jgi:glycosyltransferase involved in cell wall biosynthesis
MVLKNEKNSGVAFSLNHGLKRAGELDGVKYIARMDSDDISLKERLMV